MSFGYVYVLSNDSLPYLKIGQTSRSPESRAKELSTTGVPTPFKVAYKIYVENCEKFEQVLHRHLREYRVRNNREFFEVDLTTVVNAAEALREPIDNEGEEDDTSFDPLLYVQQLAEERVIQEEERQLKIDTDITEARTFLHALSEEIEPIDGRYNSDGNVIKFCISEYDEVINVRSTESVQEISDELDAHEYEKHAILLVQYDKQTHYFRVRKEYEGYRDYEVGLYDEYGSLAKLNKSPRQLAKHIVRLIAWATEEESKARANPSMSLKDMLQAVWVHASNKLSYMIYLELDHCYDDLDSREEMFNAHYDSLDWLLEIKMVVNELYKQGVISRIVSRSWASMLKLYGLVEPDDNYIEIYMPEHFRDYFLSIKHVVPDEPEEVGATVREVGYGSTHLSGLYDTSFSINKEYPEYVGKKVKLKVMPDDRVIVRMA